MTTKKPTSLNTLKHLTQPKQLTKLIHQLDTHNPQQTANKLNQGTCTQIGGDTFYLTTGQTTNNHDLNPTKICNTCPVQRACLLTALTTKDPHGTWAGLTPNHRRQLRKHITNHRTKQTP